MGNFYLYKIGQFLIKLVPLSWAYSVASKISDLHFRFSLTDRRAVENNLKVVLQTPEVPPNDVRDVFRNFGKYLVNFFTMTKYVDQDFIRDNVEITNIEVLNQALSYGKGGIIVSAHLGSWEMGAAVFPQLGYPLSVLALSHKDPRVNKIFNDQREFFGCSVIQTNVAIRRCIEQLRMNRFVAILAERDFTQHGLVMNFLGRPTMIPRGAAIFSIKTGAPIIPIFFSSREGHRFGIVCHDAIYPPLVEGEIPDEVLKEFMAKYLFIIEQEIKRQPTQWLNFREFHLS